MVGCQRPGPLRKYSDARGFLKLFVLCQAKSHTSHTLLTWPALRLVSWYRAQHRPLRVMLSAQQRAAAVRGWSLCCATICRARKNGRKEKQGKEGGGGREEAQRACHLIIWLSALFWSSLVFPPVLNTSRRFLAGLSHSKWAV